MGRGKLRALIVTENPQGSSYLTERLRKADFECEFARSCQEAHSITKTKEFDLVLSATRLRDGGAFSLLESLEGSGTTLFFYHPVEEGCWWLPGLRRGKRCFGTSALRPSEFVSALGRAIEEIRAAERPAAVAERPSAAQPAVAIFVAHRGVPESHPASPAHPNQLPLMKRKAAG